MKSRPDSSVGLVLGAGGVMGGAWLTGALAALAEVTGWDPASADRIVGTSAGAMIGSLLAGGVPPWFMVAHSAGEVFDGLLDSSGRPASEADRSAGAIFRISRPWIPLPGSPRLALASLRGGPSGIRRYAGWLPAGVMSTQPLQDIVRRVVPSGWAAHPALWVVACDYSTGERVVFGRPGAPPAGLAEAVAASCAIPGFYRPVRIAGRRYVDGGLHSLANLDLLQTEGLSVVICLNPMSSRSRTGSGPLAGIRGGAARELASEAALVRKRGTRVVVFEPTARDLQVMGSNPMSRTRRHAVIERARETVAAAVRRHASALEGLPKGDPDHVRRPSGHHSEWSWRPGQEAAR